MPQLFSHLLEQNLRIPVYLQRRLIHWDLTEIVYQSQMDQHLSHGLLLHCYFLRIFLRRQQL